MMQKNIFLTFSFFAFYLSSAAQDTINVADFGLKPDTLENAVRIVQKALEFCKTKNDPVLVFPKARYDFWPQYAIEKF